MTERRKLTPAELWQALEDDAARDEADRISGLSDAQLDQELREAGIDPKQARARGEQLGREAMRALAERAPKAPSLEDRDAKRAPTPIAGRRARWAGLIAAAFAAVTAAVLAYTGVLDYWLVDGVGAGAPVRPIEAGVAPDSAARARAGKLRQEGLDECDAAQWRECVDRLDAARAIDPAGEDDVRVREARARAAQGMR